MLFLLCSPSWISYLNPVQDHAGEDALASPKLLTWSLTWRSWAYTIFPNVWAKKPRHAVCKQLEHTPFIPRYRSKTKTDPQTGCSQRQVYAYLHITCTENEIVEPHYQQAGENYPHLVPGLKLMWDKMLDPLREKENWRHNFISKDSKHRHVCIQLCEEMFPKKWLCILISGMWCWILFEYIC